MGKRLLTLLLLLPSLKRMWYSLSIGRQGCCYGGVSRCKRLQISASETRWIMGKVDKCQSIMGLTNTITSPFLLQSRHNFLKLQGLLILLKWTRRMLVLWPSLVMVALAREISMLL
uniref:Secreted protein n=1 Tax=Opuntia streptacantha TaxID=393608 RepID=A0A7C9AR72_OPUST